MFNEAFLGGVYAAVTVFGFLFVVGVVLMAVSFIAWLVTMVITGEGETKEGNDDDV